MFYNALLKKIYLTLILLIPSNIEYLLQVSSNQGNMAFNGVFLEIYYNRNLLYISIPLLYFNYAWIFFIFCFYKYASSCYKWSIFILNEYDH